MVNVRILRSIFSVFCLLFSIHSLGAVKIGGGSSKQEILDLSVVGNEVNACTNLPCVYDIFNHYIGKKKRSELSDSALNLAAMARNRSFDLVLKMRTSPEEVDRILTHPNYSQMFKVDHLSDSQIQADLKLLLHEFSTTLDMNQLYATYSLYLKTKTLMAGISTKPSDMEERLKGVQAEISALQEHIQEVGKRLIDAQIARETEAAVHSVSPSPAGDASHSKSQEQLLADLQSKLTQVHEEVIRKLGKYNSLLRTLKVNEDILRENVAHCLLDTPIEKSFHEIQSLAGALSRIPFKVASTESCMSCGQTCPLIRLERVGKHPGYDEDFCNDCVVHMMDDEFSAVNSGAEVTYDPFRFPKDLVTAENRSALNFLKVKFLRTRLSEIFKDWHVCRNPECMSGVKAQADGALDFRCPHCRRSMNAAEDIQALLQMAESTHSVVNYCPDCKVGMFHMGEGCDIMNCLRCSKAFKMRPPTAEEAEAGVIPNASRQEAGSHTGEIESFLQRKYPPKSKHSDVPKK